MQTTILQEPLAVLLIILMLFLLLVIALLANVLLGSASWVYKKRKEDKDKSSGTVVTMLAIMLMAALPAQAQDAKETVGAAVKIGGLSPAVFYFMVAVVAVELLVILVLLVQLRLLFWRQKQRVEKVKTSSVKTVWNKLNKFRPVEQEADLDLGHAYDGIRELDNRLPPWWLYGFYVTIVFGIIYLWRYHVSETAPLPEQEYAIAMQQAEKDKAAYLKKSANNVDENTVKLLVDAEAMTSGKKVFDQNCAACHGMAGEGTVGPNLTDDYWLHGGSLADVFKSVKYGWPEKGMRSWKEDLSPSQISQVTSYIKSLHGTNPANAKEKQGELYNE